MCPQALTPKNSLKAPRLPMHASTPPGTVETSTTLPSLHPALVKIIREQAAEDPNPGKTEILLIDAQLVDVREDHGEQMASVFFNVVLREDARAVRTDGRAGNLALRAACRRHRPVEAGRDPAGSDVTSTEVSGDGCPAVPDARTPRYAASAVLAGRNTPAPASSCAFTLAS